MQGPFKGLQRSDVIAAVASEHMSSVEACDCCHVDQGHLRAHAGPGAEERAAETDPADAHGDRGAGADGANTQSRLGRGK